MKRVIAMLGLAAFLTAACTDEGASFAVLKAAGYSSIQLTGYDWSCGQGDGSCTGFRAKGPTGIPVTGAVGCGGPFSLKGCTVRVTGVGN